MHAIIGLRKLLEVKVIVSATLDRVSNILDVVRDWWSDDDMIARSTVQATLQCENAVAALKATHDHCQRMISQPPSYGSNHPDEQHHQLLELDVLLMRAFSLLDKTHTQTTGLRQECSELVVVKAVEDRVLDARESIEEAESITAEALGENID